MGKCQWCSKDTEATAIVQDSYGNKYKVCKSCFKHSKEHKCIKCNKSSKIIVRGLCSNCYQLVAMKMQRDLDGNTIDEGFNIESMNPEEYERWMTMGKSMSPDEIRSNKELQKMWTMLKFKLAGITDATVIQDNFENVLKIIDRSAEKLIGNKCKLAVADSKDKLNKEEQQKIIDSEGKVYIISI